MRVSNKRLQDTVSRQALPHLQILGSIAGQLQHFGSQVLCDANTVGVDGWMATTTGKGRDQASQIPTKAAIITITNSLTKNSCCVDSCCCSHTSIGCHTSLQPNAKVGYGVVRYNNSLRQQHHGTRYEANTRSTWPVCAHLQQTVDTTHRELQSGPCGP